MMKHIVESSDGNGITDKDEMGALTGSRPSDRTADGVSPVPASIPSADCSHYTADDYDYDLGDCWNCGGEGYVYGCSWDWQCDTYDAGEGSCLCTRPCHICHPPKDNPEIRKLMAHTFAQAIEARQGGNEVPSPDESAVHDSECAQPSGGQQ